MSHRPQGTAVKIKLQAPSQTECARAMRRIQKADPFIPFTEPRQLDNGTWQALGTIFVTPAGQEVKL